MKKLLLALLLILGSMPAAGCSPQAKADAPPEISYGRDICIECNMIISEPRFAASYRLDNGETKSFDGIGELLKHVHRMGELPAVADAWVHDYNTKDWILANEASYVAGREVVTPMGHGIVAFATESAARDFASDVGGMLMTWQELLSLDVGDNGLVGDHHQGDHEGLDQSEAHDHDSMMDE